MLPIALALVAFLPPLRAGDAMEPAAPLPRFERVALPTGVTLRTVELGAPDGEAVLFVHGFTDTLRSFAGTMEELARLRPELRLVALELRGHGGSTLPDPERCAEAPERCFGVPELARDVLALMDVLELERAHVVGHSLGSLVAQELALAQPARVERLVLIGAGARTRGTRFVEEYIVAGALAAWRARVEARGLCFPADVYASGVLDAVPSAADWLRESWVYEPAAGAELLGGILRDCEATPVGTWAGVAGALLELDHRERLAELRAPTLVLWGTHDVAFGAAEQAELRAALARAQRRHGTPWWWKAYGSEPLPASGEPGRELGHNFHWAAPRAVAEDLAAFLRPGGAPTRDLCRADLERGRGVVVERGAAEVVAGAARAASSR